MTPTYMLSPLKNAIYNGRHFNQTKKIKIYLTTT